MKLNKKGISPVIATVIIVAVAIAVAIAVAYWVTGIIPAFTRYEELKISTSYIMNNATYPEGLAYIEIRNTGSADATIDEVLVNGRLSEGDVGGVAGVDGWDADMTLLTPGNSTTIVVDAADYPAGSFESGVVYDFTVHSAGGGSYPASARAP